VNWFELILILIRFCETSDIKFIPFKRVLASQFTCASHSRNRQTAVLKEARLYFTEFFWSPNSPYAVDYHIWTTMQEPVYHIDIQSVEGTI